MAMDPRLHGYLTRALCHEMAAVQQYMAQSKLCDLWGMAEYCSHFRQDVIEELGHVESLMEALIKLGVTPNATQLPAVRLGRSMEEMFAIDRVLEVEAVRLYEEAAAYCWRVRDDGHHALFSKILRDELQHLDELDKLSASLLTKEKRCA
ncbi:MAG TPA: ferritin-like domain-containing protein [Thiobacillus sp.]|nr:bacterioferritin [Gammaproteobacteria bacterium]MDO9008375.1 ferritin-like domain-containing protein [Thiobacillus sp.]MBU4500583.1 bacterioferritin [Gammaproteobacteria bacterium]MDP3124165.1 ferritin-like domain-containing protein [Thiobacillus sp.]HQT30503.1 ferritin-like domain-containing protein [Thiobacillus sp.]